jgi:hypothetical protein
VPIIYPLQWQRSKVHKLLPPGQLTRALAQACELVHHGQLCWQYQRMACPPWVMDCFEAAAGLNAEPGQPIRLILQALRPMGVLPPTELGEWQVLVSLPESSQQSVLDGRRLTLTQQAAATENPITLLFGDAFQSLCQQQTRWIPTLQQLHVDCLNGRLPVSRTRLKADRATDFSGGWLWQIGAGVQLPRLEVFERTDGQRSATLYPVTHPPVRWTHGELSHPAFKATLDALLTR